MLAPADDAQGHVGLGEREPCTLEEGSGKKSRSSAEATMPTSEVAMIVRSAETRLLDLVRKYLHKQGDKMCSDLAGLPALVAGHQEWRGQSAGSCHSGERR